MTRGRVDRTGVVPAGGVMGNPDPNAGTFSLYCVHDRIANQCEDCAMVRLAERGERVIKPDPVVDEREQLEVDTLFRDPTSSDERPVEVLVIAGDRVPNEVKDWARRPRPLLPDKLPARPQAR